MKSTKFTKPKPLKPSSNSLSWIKQVRALPSNPNSNDFLKLEYIDINLNNSRKLIHNLDSLTESTGRLVNDVDIKINGGMIGLNRVKASLDWLE